MKDKRIVIAGGTGLLGSACADLLRTKGYDVQILSRKTSSRPDMIQWDPAARSITANVVDGAYAVINLTGTPLDGKRWTDEYKKVLHQSRVEPAEFLGQLIGDAAVKPEVYIGAAGIGIYGDSGPAPVSESHTGGHESDFVVKLSEDWENAHPRIEGMRTVVLRIAVVMAAESGFLPSVLKPAQTGVFAYFGDGSQHLGWIHLEDLARMVSHSIESAQVNGTYNAAAGSAPLKSVMSKVKDAKGAFGIVAPVPGFVAKVVLGEMADMLMWSCNPANDKIVSTGFEFKFRELQPALEALLR